MAPPRLLSSWLKEPSGRAASRATSRRVSLFAKGTYERQAATVAILAQGAIQAAAVAQASFAFSWSATRPPLATTCRAEKPSPLAGHLASAGEIAIARMAGASA